MEPSTDKDMTLFLGLDFGTSGARAIAIDDNGDIHARANCSYPVFPSKNRAFDWQSTLWKLLQELPLEIRQQVQAIAIDGTSSTTLLCDASGQPLHAPLMYNDDRASQWLSVLTERVPPQQVVLSATSGLAKLCWLLSEMGGDAAHCLSQADWLGWLLHGRLGVSDYHNCLKLGYDVGNLCWPNWLDSLQVNGRSLTPFLPQVLTPGDGVGAIQERIVQRYNFPPTCQVKAGTTDSIAAFLASGVHKSGHAVTSLGSTLAVKLLSERRVDHRRYGIYSHRLGDSWLVGGASNTGGAVLRQFFRDAQLRELSDRIDPTKESCLDYYPLCKPGERFPVNDAELVPRLAPRPQNDADFLHGLFEGMAQIEARGYQLLEELGGTAVTRVFSAGGGASNQTWTAIRERKLGVPVRASPHMDAAYGTAILAMKGLV